VTTTTRAVTTTTRAATTMTRPLELLLLLALLAGCPPGEAEVPFPEIWLETTWPQAGSDVFYRRDSLQLRWSERPPEELEPWLEEAGGDVVPAELTRASTRHGLTPDEPLEPGADYVLHSGNGDEIPFRTSRIGLPIDAVTTGSTWHLAGSFLVTIAQDEAPRALVGTSRWGGSQHPCLPTGETEAVLGDDDRTLRIGPVDVWLETGPLRDLEATLECSPEGECRLVEGSYLLDMRFGYWWSPDVDTDCPGCEECGPPSEGEWCAPASLDGSASLTDVSVEPIGCAEVAADPECAAVHDLWDPDEDGYPQFCDEVGE